MDNLFVEVTETDSTPTPALWGGIPLDSILKGTIPGAYAFEDNFRNGPGQWQVYGTDSGASNPDNWIKPLAVAGGGMRMTTGSADNDEFAMQASQAFSLPAAGSYLFAMEAYVRPESKTTQEQGWFVGLAEAATPLAATGILATDTKALADIDYLGFHTNAEDTTGLDFAYNEAAAGTAAAISECGTLDAATWIKIGLLIDYRISGPTAATRGAIYINGTKYTTSYLTETILEGANWPTATNLVPTVALSVGTGAAKYLDIGWFRAAYMPV